MANASIIPEDLNTLKKEYLILRKELDSANQELYGCKRQLKVAEALELEYQNEIKLLTCEQSAYTKKLEEKIVQLEESISSVRSKYNEQIQNLELEISKIGKENEDLTAEIELLKKTNIDISTDDFSKVVDEVIELKREHEALLESEEQMKLSVEILQKNNFTLEEALKECREELSDVKESLSCKRRELFEANDLVQELRDELCCLKSELDSFKSKPLKEESQGNSLFAEVNDRRVQLQKTINSMKKDYDFMKQERAKNLNTICHLKTENKILCERWKTEMEEREDDQDMNLKAYKDHIRILENLIENYKKDLSAKPLVISPGNLKEIEFYQVTLNHKVKEIEDLRNQLSRKGLSLITVNTALREANEETRKWKLEAALKQCELDLKTADVNLESKCTEKLEADMKTDRIELRQMKSEPHLACKKEERKIEPNMKEEAANKLIVECKKEEQVIVIDESLENIDLDEKNESSEDKENIAAPNKASKSVTFSQNTVSPKITDRSAMRTNCIRVVVPKPIYIRGDKVFK